jgi:hypothetical protein
LFVGDHDDRLAAFGDLLEDIGDEFGVSAIEVSGGFVGEEDGGFVGECAGDGDALLFAAGEAIGFAFEFVGEAKIFEEVCGAVHGEGAFEPGEFEHWECDVFLGGEFLEEVMELEDEADFLVAEDGEFDVAEGGGIGTVDEDAAGWFEGLAVVVVLGGSIEAAEEVEEGAFTGAAGSYDGDIITAGDSDGDAFEDVGGGFAGAEEAVEVLRSQEGERSGGGGWLELGESHGVTGLIIRWRAWCCCADGRGWASMYYRAINGM